jgi:hypothetical protein
MALREMKELRMVALHGLYNVPLLKMMRLEELHKPRSFHADLKRRIMPTQLERRSARAAVAVTVRCGSVSQTDRPPPGSSLLKYLRQPMSLAIYRGADSERMTGSWIDRV